MLISLDTELYQQTNQQKNDYFLCALSASFAMEIMQKINRRSRGNSNIVDIFHICIMKEVKKKLLKKMAN